MWEEVLSVSYTFLKIFTGFAIIIVYLKLSNKSQITELTPIDFIGNLILGGIIGEMIYTPEISFIKYFIMLVLAIGLISSLNFISARCMIARHAIMGSAIPIIVNGQLQFDSINNKDIKFDLIEFMSMLRAKEIFSLEEVEFAQVEANGELTVIKKGNGYLNYLLVKSGHILTTELEKLGKNEDWLNQHLAELNLSLEDLFLVEFSNNNRFYIVKCDGKTVTKNI